MRWAITMKNLEAGKWQLITPDMDIDPEDPRYDKDMHIVPIVEDPNNPTYLSFGIHALVRDCPCHPRIEEGLYRNRIKHRAAMN